MFRRLDFESIFTAGVGSIALFASCAASAAALTTPPTEVTTASPSAANEPDSATADTLGEVVVTGTRIERPGFSSPTPLTAIGEDALQTRAPSNLIDALVLLPQFRKSATPQTGGLGTGNTGGGSFLNARGLGPNRTLVLLDGERIVPTTSIETVDISLLPQALIKRVDVVTGGASAAYGSDAVAGVVNFVLDTGFRGFKTQIDTGTSTVGDGRQVKGSLTWGADLNDRLHMLSSVEYFSLGQLGPTDRDWHSIPYGVVQNPAYTATNGQRPLLLAPNYYVPNATFGGLILGGPLANTQFLPGGATSRYVPCGPQAPAYIACSSAMNLPWNDYGDVLVSPVQRASGYTRLTFDIAPGSELFVDALVADSKTSFNVLTATTQLNGPITIQSDNAFLPTAVRNQMTALGLSSFSLGRFSADFGVAPTTKDASVSRFSGGLKLALGNNWTAKVYGTYGESRLLTSINNTENSALLAQAIDSVISPTTGQPVCRSSLTNPGNGCVPVNVFGNGSPSAAAISHFTGSEITDLRISQALFGASLAGDLFSTWAGPVSAAFGGEARSESVRQSVDNVSLNNGWLYNNPKPLDGTIRVGEGYAEVVVPLASDRFLVKSLELNAAGRVTHYNTSGTVETWKAGLTYSPVSDIRFRATRSRDIRAPNAVELFSPLVGAGAGVSVVDPRNGQPVLVRQLTGGNTALKPEIADTNTVGFVVQPLFLPGFEASVDYYDIRIKDAISTLNIQSIVGGCQAGNAQYCTLVVRDPSGTLVQVTNAVVNVNNMTTRGLDLEAGYTFGLSAIDLPGSLGLHALGNYVKDYLIGSGAVVTNYAGDMLNTGIPSWSGDFSAEYKDRGFTFLTDAAYIGGGKYNVLLDIQNNHVNPVWYLNTALEQRFNAHGTDLTVLFNVDNIFNKSPPFGFANGGSGPNYDHLGRYFKLGVRLEM